MTGRHRGRPRQLDDGVAVTVVLERATVDRLDALARVRREPRSQVVRDAIDSELARIEQLAEGLRRSLAAEPGRRPRRRAAR